MDGVRMALGEIGMSVEQGRLNALDRRWELIVRSEYCSVKMQSICMCSHCAEVCTHLYIVQAGSCWKCELYNCGMYVTWG